MANAFQADPLAFQDTAFQIDGGVVPVVVVPGGGKIKRPRIVHTIPDEPKQRQRTPREVVEQLLVEITPPEPVEASIVWQDTLPAPSVAIVSTQQIAAGDTVVWGPVGRISLKAGIQFSAEVSSGGGQSLTEEQEEEIVRGVLAMLEQND